MHLVPREEERTEIVTRLHQSMGNSGIKRVMDRLRPKYWWRKMEETVAAVLRACEPCDRVKAGFRQSAADLQPLPLQRLMFR